MRKIGPMRLRIAGDDAGIVARIDALFADFPTVRGSSSHVLELTTSTPAGDLFSAKLNGDSICRKRGINDVELLVTRALNRQVLDGEPDWLHLHAGAVTNGLHTVLVIGESMAGKSTLVAKLVSEGWQYLTDEAIGVRETGELIGYPRPITLRRSSWAFFDGVLPEGLSRHAARIEVCASNLGHVYDGPAVTPTIVVRPDVTAQHLGVERLTAAQTTAMLVANSLDLERAGLAGRNAMVSIAERAPSFRVAGRDLEVTCQTVASLCESAEPPGAVIDTEHATARAGDRRSRSATAWLFPDRSAAIHDDRSGVHLLVDDNGFHAWRSLGFDDSLWPPQAATSPFVLQLIAAELLDPAGLP